jgi:hypothetical protein
MREERNCCLFFSLEKNGGYDTGEAEEEKEEKVRSSHQGRNLDTGQVLNLSESGTDFPPQYALLGHPDPLPTTFLPAPFDDAGVSKKVPYRLQTSKVTSVSLV